MLCASTLMFEIRSRSVVLAIGTCPEFLLPYFPGLCTSSRVCLLAPSSDFHKSQFIRLPPGPSVIPNAWAEAVGP